jgi:hypothetical protein
MSPADEFISMLLLETQGASRLRLEAIWRVFLRWRPELSTAGNKRSELARFLEQGKEAGAFSFPKGKQHFDRAAIPPLPEWIAFPLEKAPVRPAFDHRAYPWHTAMAFVAALSKLANSEDAMAINRFLVNDRNPPRVPAKERSYEIFGDEKRLSAVLDGVLGASLTLDVLNCYIPDFVPVHRAGDLQSRRVLIIENEATFDSFCRWNRQHPTWHTVVFGRGIEVWKAETFLRETWPAGTDLEYFGDFDQAGVGIAHRLAQILEKHGLRLRPLLPAYRHLINQSPRPDAKGSFSNWLEAIRWLEDAEVIASATSTFGLNRRVAQEAFGWRQLTSFGLGDL